jgi:hypothetical protein
LSIPPRPVEITCAVHLCFRLLCYLALCKSPFSLMREVPLLYW